MMTTTMTASLSYSVIHVLPGRIRLRVPELASNQGLANQLTDLLTREKGVISVRINFWASSIVIQCDERKNKEITANFLVFLEKANHLSLSIPQTQPELTKSEAENWSSLTLPALATLLSFGSKQLAFPWLRPIAIGTLILAAYPVAKRAIASILVDQKLNIDCLDLLALVLSGLQGKLVTPALVITLHELGDIIRERTARSTERQTSHLLDAIGHLSWVEREGTIIQVPSDSILEQEIVIVYPGERISVDGTVSQGEAIIDQQQLTGESMPVVAKVGTYVYASTLVRSGKIRIIAERVGQKTRAAASIELLEKAPIHDTRMANYAGQMAEKLIVPSLVLASIVGLTSKDPTKAASILTLDFVTGIRLSLPTAFLGALNHTTRHGILVRSGRTLELLSEIDTIVFDKTGTLTKGDVVVTQVEAIGKLSANAILQLAASAEQRITHPVAESICNYARQQGIEILPRGDWSYEIGLGMKASIDGKTVLVGSEKFLKQEGINLDFCCEYPPIQETCDLHRQTVISKWFSSVYVACDGEFQGVIQYTDPIRPESRSLIQKLQDDYGMTIHLLTGDNQQKATEVAHVLNIPASQVHAEAFPEQKAKIVRDLHSLGNTVAFVGDGLNDSVALAYADVSISFAAGSEVARDTADVVLMNDDISSVLEAIAIAKETKNLIEQNILLVVGPNLVALGFATTVGLNPLLATIIHNGTAIIAGLNSLRPLVQHQLELSS